MTPLLSYIVLSYNYEHYIGIAIRSILAQRVQNFEIVVVDDASTDGSCDVVRAFHDPRIRLIVNERNLGGAGAYNVAVAAARGEWLVNLDADDWIAPEKSDRQLTAAAQDPRTEIIATWVDVVGPDGQRHPDASVIEEFTNGDQDLNLADSWIGSNRLCRSSTMVRRDAHLRIGLDDDGMVAAPDYELWTRALAAGCRFHLIKERLTFMRRHGRGVTFADPLRSFLEICFALHKNLLPHIERRALWSSFNACLHWVGANSELPSLGSRERERLVGLLVTGPLLPDYRAFRAAVATPASELERTGRHALVMLEHLRLEGEWSWREIKRHAQTYKEQAAYIQQLIEVRDYFKGQSEAWQLEARRQSQLCEEQSAHIEHLSAALDGEGDLH